jgi:hypothetical protein
MTFATWTPPAPIHQKIAERWKAQYCRGGAWRFCGDGKGSKQIYQELLALGPNPNPADIEMIIGNDSWTRPDESMIADLSPEPGNSSETERVEQTTENVVS